MKTWLSSKTVVCGLAILLGACGGDDKDEGGSSLAGCSDMCAKIAPLNCPGDMGSNCQAECDSLDDQAPQCASQAGAYVSCASARPATDYACDIDGEGDLIETACAAERDGLFGCLIGGGGAAGMNGGGTCPSTNDGECDEPDFCDPGTDTADCS